MKREPLVYSIIGCVIAMVMLIYALGDLEIGYYQLLRFVIFIVAILTAYTANLFNRHIVVVLSVIAAVLFNPFAKVILSRDSWQSIDVIGAFYFLVVTIVFSVELKHLSEKAKD